MFLCNACHHSLDEPRGLNRRKKEKTFHGMQIITLMKKRFFSDDIIKFNRIQNLINFLYGKIQTTELFF